MDRVQNPPGPVLSQELRELYGGDLYLRASSAQRPWVVGNFVSTLDGVVSYKIHGHAGGSTISGCDAADRFIMGLLRASVDAVLIGAETIRDTSPDDLWTPESTYPGAKLLFSDLRRKMLQKQEYPLLVVVSGSGRLDLERAAFHTPKAPALILTTAAGKSKLVAAGASQLPSVKIKVLESVRSRIDAAAMLQVLMAEFGIRTLLHEGGPTLLGQFLAAGLVDELFLTLAPQIAGRMPRTARPGIVEGLEFLPESAPWFELLSVKNKDEHLYLRYRRREVR